MRSIARPVRRNIRRRAALAALTAVLAVVPLATPASASPAVAASAAAANSAPVGSVERLREGDAGVYVRGWGYDPDTAKPVRVHISLDHKRLASVPANLPRPGIAKQHPGHGKNLGFHLMAAVPAGKHLICVNLVDYPSHEATQLLCRTVNFVFNPIGKVTAVTQSPGHLTATGWALDDNDPATARAVYVRVDGTRVATTTANLPVQNFGSTHPRAGDNHGFSVTFPIAEGTHRVCFHASNIGAGASVDIACVVRTVNFSPTGKVTALAQAPGAVVVTGYATDPDSTATTTVTVLLQQSHGKYKTLGTLPANDATGPKPGYSFTGRLALPGPKFRPGDRTVCVRAKNIGRYGRDTVVGCATKEMDWNPTVRLGTLTQRSPGAQVTGWAIDPDTNAPISVHIYGDGTKLATVTAGDPATKHSGHHYTATIPLSDGKHTVCVSAVNVRFGTGDSPQACKSITLAFEPYGKYETVTRAKGSSDLVATGWAIDPDSNTRPVPVQVSVDGGKPVTGKANLPRPDVAKQHPGTGKNHGFAVTAPAGSGEHRVCVTALNILGGSGKVNLGCKVINAVHPKPASAPRAVTAIAGYGGARIVWSAPTSDGGAPWTGYTVRALPNGPTMQVGANVDTATLLGLKPSTKYTFSVVANNVAGASAAGVSAAVTTQKQPPAQTSPAPISTSRYVRNITSASKSNLAMMRNEGAADAKANPSGHGYLIVLDIGGQDESRQGVILTAGIRFISYAALVANLNAYVAGYASRQKPSAPVTFAIATNNDIDVSKSSGANFANSVIDPVARYAKHYPGITIAGSDDMEPGFRASYRQTSAWLTGFLHATQAPFVFTGSADGCAWTLPGRSCNNGWTMRGLYHLSGGASPIRIIGLPQVYNDTMAQQWRFISLTGVDAKQPRIDFGGALTEWTACHQAHSCGSLTGNNAWKVMWQQLRAEPKLRPSSLPYSTDLRIDS